MALDVYFKPEIAAKIAAVLLLDGDERTLQALALAFGIEWQDILRRQPFIVIENGE